MTSLAASACVGGSGSAAFGFGRRAMRAGAGDPVPALSGAEGAAENAVDLPDRGCSHGAAGVGLALGNGAIVAFVVRLVFLDEGLAGAADAAAPEFRVEAFQRACVDLLDRHVAERRNNRPRDVPGVGVAGALLQLADAHPLVQRVGERDGRRRGALPEYLRAKLGEFVFCLTPHLVIRAVDSGA